MRKFSGYFLIMLFVFFPSSLFAFDTYASRVTEVESAGTDLETLNKSRIMVRENTERFSVYFLIQKIEEEYEKIKEWFFGFLKTDVKEEVKNFLVKESQTEIFEKNLNNEKMVWFLAGAGVFLVGFFIGFFVRKKRRPLL